MPRTYQGIEAPEGFTTYASKVLAKNIPVLKNKYQFTNWFLREHVKKPTLTKWIRDYKKMKGVI